MKRILLSAFACDPIFGSDEEVGWQWAKELSNRKFDVTVITRRTHQYQIEKYIAEFGDCKNVHFQYVDIEWLYPILTRVNRRNHIYYYFWQWAAYRQAKRIQALRPFDFVHHVTWVSFRQPSFMGMLNVPMIFGPVAGGDDIPPGYTKYFSFKQKLVELFRRLINACVRFDPLMRMTYRSADQVFFTSEAHLKSIPSFVIPKAKIELAIGCAEVTDIKNSSVHTSGARLLYVGRCIALKGMDLGLRVFSEVHKVRPDATLTIIGDGVDRNRWESTANELGIADAITWLGWVAKSEVVEMYNQYDILFNPSLRDSGGFVVLEALQQGLPVACLKLGGPGVIVNDSCGVAVNVDPDINKTIMNYKNSVIDLLNRIEVDKELPKKCNERVKAFTWRALIERIYGRQE